LSTTLHQHARDAFVMRMLESRAPKDIGHDSHVVRRAVELDQGGRKIRVTAATPPPVIGVTEFIDHYVPEPAVTNGNVLAPAFQRRLESLWFGKGYATRTTAFAVADYTGLGSDGYGALRSFTFPAANIDSTDWRMTTTINITGLPDIETEGTETIQCTIIGSDAYAITSGGGLSSQITILDMLPTDLGIDSNNDTTINNSDDAIEDDADKPGKLIAVNDDDTDGDGIPDFADFNGNTGENFVPMVLRFPAGVDLSQATFRLNYDDSPPPAVTGSGTITNPYAPGPGVLRVWKKSGSLARNGDPINAGGDWWEDNGAYTAAQLGVIGQSREVTLWVEAVGPSISIADQRVLVQVSTGGSGPWSGQDAVRLTAVDVNFNKVYSDQFADASENFRQDVPTSVDDRGFRGSGAWPFLIMGVRDDYTARVRADITVTPDIPAVRDNLVFALKTLNANSSAITGLFSLTGSIVKADALPIVDSGLDRMRIMWGFDSNTNGLAEPVEPSNAAPFDVWVVDGGDYYRSFVEVSNLIDQWSVLGLTYAANFLYAFQQNLPTSGATSAPTRIEPDAAFRDHNVGVIASGGNNAIRNTFTANSEFAIDITNSRDAGHYHPTSHGQEN
jgi:hypothetical protein